MKTELCDVLGIEYPIIQGAMAHISDGKFAATVSEAGGLGVIASTLHDGQWVKEQVEIARSITDKPFAVNLIMESDIVEECARMCVELKVPICTISAGNPEKIVPILVEGGIKVICLIPSCDGRIYELRKMEQGEFIAPKNNVVDFSEIRAGFIPALPKIPAQLMGEIIAFFRSFMTESEENEAMAQIYWDKAEKRFFAYVPKQSVCKEEVEANLHDCPYDDEERYICYADIHSHNSMDAFFSGKDDRDECSTGLYLVLGKLDHFYPEIKARIFCGDSFVPIDPAEVVEGLEQPFPQEWLGQGSGRSALPKKGKKRNLRELLSEVW